MIKRFLRICSTLLVLCMLVNMLPMSVFAEEIQQSLAQSETVSEEAVSEDAYVVSEVVENRTEYSKEFRLSNGLHVATVYADPVHYETDSGWEEIDNTLKTNTDGTYSNTEGVWEVKLPQQLSGEESVTIEKDGYTLSFSLTGELNTSEIATYSRDGGGFTVKQAKKSRGKVEKMDWDTMRQSVEHEEMVPEKSESRLTYSDIYENTDIIYDLDSNTVKESIVLESYNDTLQGYSYTLEVGSMVPVLGEDGTITLYDEKQKTVIMVMPAPYLVDGAGEYCYDIEVQLTGSGSTYTLNYILPTHWLAEESRAWPVVLDPAVKPTLTTSNIRDITVFEKEANKSTELKKWYKDWGMIQAGYYGADEGISRAYLKYNALPSLTSSDVIISATVRLYKPETSEDSAVVEVHKVTGPWNTDSITWANKPVHDANIEDYATVQDAKFYGWTVTDIVRDWYANSNTGMMFKVSDEVETAGKDNFKQFISSDYTEQDDFQPFLTIYFRNNNGLESYWDYTASSAGRAGTGYVNNFTGNMTWVRGDIGFDGNRMPVSINHVYNLNDLSDPDDSNNSNETAGNAFGMGLGWRTNYNQLVYQWNVDKSYYIWEDSDGTDHYFTKDSDGKLTDEDGLELTLTTTGSGTETYCITDKYGNCSYFDSAGRLSRMTNNQQTKSSITITYKNETSKLISVITDGAGRKYDFTYSNGLLSRISYKGTGTSELSYVDYSYVYEYDTYRLETVKYKDGKTCTYDYSVRGLMWSAQDIDGYKLSYTYNSGIESWQPYRVLGVSASDGSASGGSLSFSYAHNQTTVTDHNGNVEVLQFNDLGNLTCIQDDEGRAQYAQYAKNTDDDTGKANQLTLSSDLQYASSNLLQDGCMRYESYAEVGTDPLYSDEWETVGGETRIGITTASSYFDTRSQHVTVLQNSEMINDQLVYEGPCGIENRYSIGPGETYTFSGYVKPYSCSVFLEIECGNDTVTSETAAVSSSWKRLQVTYTNKSNSAQTMEFRVLSPDEEGEFYVDCVQLEKAHTASRYNMVMDGDFNLERSRWYGTGYSSSSEGATKLSASAAPQLDNTVFKIVGDPTEEKEVYQIIYAKGKAGYSYVLAGWAKGNAAPLEPVKLYEDDTSPDRVFAICARFKYDDDTYSDYFTASFNPDTDQWQYSATAMVAEKAFSAITVRLTYNYNVNTVYFDGIQLSKDEFGSCYTYDDDGNVVSVVDTSSKKTEYEYSSNDLTKEIIDGTAEMTYTYDSYHNVKTATTKEGLVYTFEYDKWGNNTSVSITDGTSTMVSTATYSSDGNHLVSTTDAMGQVTSYGYNSQTGMLEWVQYPNDTEQTRTEYTYDSMYRMASAACTTDTGNSLSASYTYEDDQLSKIETESTAYSFTYGSFGLRSKVSVGNRTLASYTYTNDQNNYLKKLAYGNGDSVEYTYDDEGRVTKKTYEDGSSVSNQYDDSGFWTSNTDSATGITTTYTYDYQGRLRLYEETGTDYSFSLRYTYNSKNQLTHILELVDGHDRGTRYTYDEDDRLTRFKKAHSIRTYTYDAFSRVSATQTLHDDTVIYDTDYTFTAPSDTKTGGQVASMRNRSAGYDVTYSYTYDDNGNILTISDGTNTTSYVYDSANQLIRENNQAENYTYTWEYDNAGNILDRKEYAYTTEENLDNIPPTDTVTYTYGDSEWGDLLTAYDGTAITYDGIGNPLSDGTWTYTWEHGRELASMTDGETTWSYTYNADGMRIGRTDGTTTYEYIYAGSEIIYTIIDGVPLRLSHTTDGTPLSVVYKGGTYYYVTNLQGDVVAILDEAGNQVVGYTYDAWGNILSVTGSMADTLGQANPLRYRGYVYDNETGLYYLQSRYYDPEVGRFINADSVTSTGQGFVGNNMFAYCLNNPVNFIDTDGKDPEALFVWWAGSTGWLCVVDGILPIGELICIGGLIVISTLSFEISNEIASEMTSWDHSAVESTTVSPNVTTRSSALDVIRSLAASKPVNLPSWKKLKLDFDHIKTGHMPGGSRNPRGNKSVFYGLTAVQVIEAIKEAYNNCTKIATRANQIMVEGYSATYDLIIDIWVDVENYIIKSAWPK